MLSSEVIIPLIADTRATKGRTALSCLGTISPLGRTISDEDMAPLRVLRDDIHSEWSNTMLPRSPLSDTGIS